MTGPQLKKIEVKGGDPKESPPEHWDAVRVPSHCNTCIGTK